MKIRYLLLHVIALASLGSRTSAAPLDSAADTEISDVMEALAEIPNDPRSHPNFDAYDIHLNGTVQGTIHKTKDPGALQSLFFECAKAQAIPDPDPDAPLTKLNVFSVACMNIIGNLGDIGTPDALESLIAIATDPRSKLDGELALTAVDSLAKFGKAAQPALEAAGEHPIIRTALSLVREGKRSAFE